MTAIPRARLPWALSWPGLLLAVAVALAWRGSGGDLAALVGPEARAAAGDFARGFWPPAHDPELLASLARPLAETVAIALLGMALALVLGIPLALLAASPDVLTACGARAGPGRRAAHALARGVLATMRSVPEIVWALLFVRAVGLGPQAGVLALGIGYGGVIGKVFADLIEGVPRAAAGALGAAGARPWSAFAMGILPPARPLLASYALYRLDCALRASAVLGLVGAGGVGQQLELSLKMLRYDEVATWVLALFLLVAAVDVGSQLLRRRVAAQGSLFPRTRRALALRLAAALGAVAALAGAARVLDLDAAALLSADSARSMAAFLRGLWPPDLSASVVRELVPRALETLAISVLGTALAAVLGLALAFAAARPLSRVPGAEPRGAARAGGAALALAVRGVMNLGRTLPELLWALAFVLAVGLGPFAGALALGVHTSGVLGRLYFEALEEVPGAPLAALRDAGASGAGLAAHGLWPQVFPQLVAYTLYRWEVNIRASAVLGVVGAGGLGRDLKLALSWFDYPRATTLVLTILVLVLAVDAASAVVRRRILRGPPESAARERMENEKALAA
ncbi:MAG TPA: phosphonate ABC transporter, permease protein PhnE [Anaeromyxobacteraceae bacterium]|nr:phosphonate ABC transporter, permease protein PhnE [Anaeromyxobacteraceae bacterium]